MAPPKRVVARKAFVRGRRARLSAARVERVIITSERDDLRLLLKTVKRHGGKICHIIETPGIVVAEVPVSDVSLIAAMPSVKSFSFDRRMSPS
jgi:hypothetical protein